MEYRRSARVVGFALIGTLWLLAALIFVSVIYEFAAYDAIQWLTTKRHVAGSHGQNVLESDLIEYYRPFYAKYIHPIYMFYYPLDQEERVALSNKVVSLTRNGFRGEEPNPDKGLMFILGGSAAFGYMASNDNTTISAYLNQYQGGLQVVNAAVIGWSSTQELARLTNEIALFKPRVVISYSLFNDINIALHYATEGIHLPPGSPRGFDKLDEIVRDVSGLPLKRKARYLLENVLPRTTRLLVGAAKPQNFNEEMSGEITSALDAAADKFLDNEQMMYHISREYGFSFVTVIQPTLYAHNKAEFGTENESGLYRHVFEKVLKSDYCMKNCLNYSNIFDAEFDRDKIRNKLFLDPVHLADVGNQYVARRLIADLKLQ